tara:strand:+ start:506 stop:1183 length:678 start_codon:yes stop_codon:yes gene_type:complete
MINVVCVYYGIKYSLDYVQVLYNMVQRHLTVPHKFICFSDHVKPQKLLKGDITFRKFKHHDYYGWWNKLQLFSEEAHLTGTCLYLDLDIVILDNIDEIATFGDDMTFGVINDFNPNTKEFNSSVMKFNNDVATKAIWSKFLEKKAKLMELQGDQNVMSKLIKGNVNLKVMPDEWTFSYKWYSRTDPRFGKTRWTFEKKPNAKIAVFHGSPRPHESEQKWVQKEWN